LLNGWLHKGCSIETFTVGSTGPDCQPDGEGRRAFRTMARAHETWIAELLPASTHPKSTS